MIDRIRIGRAYEAVWLNAPTMRPPGLAWSKRWNYEGWMLTGVDAYKSWIEDAQAELMIVGHYTLKGFS